jgi:hypothetical protein
MSRSLAIQPVEAPAVATVRGGWGPRRLWLAGRGGEQLALPGSLWPAGCSLDTTRR